MWFYDSVFYPEGHYGCRWHECDEIDHVTRLAGHRSRPKTWGSGLPRNGGITIVPSLIANALVQLTITNVGKSAAHNVIISVMSLDEPATPTNFDPFQYVKTGTEKQRQSWLALIKDTQVKEAEAINRVKNNPRLSPQQIQYWTDIDEQVFGEEISSDKQAINSVQQSGAEAESPNTSGYAGYLAVNVSATSTVPVNGSLKKGDAQFVFGTYRYDDELGQTHWQQFCFRYNAWGTSPNSCLEFQPIPTPPQSPNH
jgi:hypothetical protein